MTIYYLLAEAVPDSSNPESREFGGAYISCWIQAETKEEAISRANAYIREENWRFVDSPELFIARKQFYANEPDSARCYDEACEYGISAMFHTWPIA